jgi:hypothetical protein
MERVAGRASVSPPALVWNTRKKSKQKKKAIYQLKLPFEVYIYSSQDSES